MPSPKIRILAICICVLALLCLCTMTLRAWQISHSDLSTKLDNIQAQHAVMSNQLSAQEEHFREIDRQLEEFRRSNLPERIAKNEQTNELNKELLVGIILGLLGLIGERVLMHAGAFGKTR